MLPILTPGEAAARDDGEFLTGFYWRTGSVLLRVAEAAARNTCGELCSLRTARRCLRRPSAPGSCLRRFRE